MTNLVRRSYAEFSVLLPPDRFARMNANLAGVVAAGADGEVLGAYVGPTLVGTVTYLPAVPRAYAHVPPEWGVIRALAVDPTARGRGVGRELVAWCLARAGVEGVPTVGLHTASWMVAARALYEGYGFTLRREFDHLGAKFCVYGLDLTA